MNLTAPASSLKAVLHKRKGVALGLWGQAGIGKTYTAHELLRVTACRASSLHATIPLPTLANSLPRAKRLPLWAEHTLTGLARGEAVEEASVLDALVATLTSLAPFVLHLEDLHDTDQARIQFIQNLASVVIHLKGVGLLVTSRKNHQEG